MIFYTVLPLKRRKKANHGSDASNDFPGFWWFVKADEVLAVFDLQVMQRCANRDTFKQLHNLIK